MKTLPNVELKHEHPSTTLPIKSLELTKEVELKSILGDLSKIS